MFPTKVLAKIYDLPSQKLVDSIGYDNLFKGEASAPPVAATNANWLFGLRPVEYDVDVYFKDVFAGPIF